MGCRDTDGGGGGGGAQPVCTCSDGTGLLPRKLMWPARIKVNYFLRVL